MSAVLCLISNHAFSQFFVDINAGIAGVSYSSAEWGDFDNDKDLDLIIAGASSGGNGLARIYRNDNGVFTDLGAALENIQKCSVAWGDYDNDGDLDILMTGENTSSKTTIYKNNEGQFEELSLTLPYFGAYSFSCWGDYDMDGDLDFFISGNWDARIFRNDGNDVFTDAEMGIMGLSSPRADWGDYDYDGDPDLILTGDTGGGMKAYIYRNQGGEFTQIELSIQGLCAGSVEWGDYDSDNDLDILMMGFDDILEPLAEIFRNDGDNNFSRIYAGLAPVTMGRVTWGDYENDGDLDVLLTGKIAGCGTFTSAVYENLGNDYFTELTSSGLSAAQNSYAAWGDFDNDNDLDIFLCGLGNSAPFSKIYRNEAALPNHIPDIPENLNALVNGTDVTLSWDKALDNETPQNALTYNLRLSTTPGGCDLLSPMAHIDAGYRKIVNAGNCGSLNEYNLTGLLPGIYFWSVQTIDNAFSASPFSIEQSFTVGLTDIQDNFSAGRSLSVYPNPADGWIALKFVDERIGKGPISIEIYKSDGSLVLKRSGNESAVKFDTGNLEPGHYFAVISDGQHSLSNTFIIFR